MDLMTLEKRLDQVISTDMTDQTPGMVLMITKGEEVLIRKSYGQNFCYSFQYKTVYLCSYNDAERARSYRLR